MWFKSNRYRLIRAILYRFANYIAKQNLVENWFVHDLDNTDPLNSFKKIKL